MKNFLIITGAVIIGVLISTFVLGDPDSLEPANAAHHGEAAKDHQLENSPQDMNGEDSNSEELPLPAELYSSAPAGAKVFFVEPVDGAVVTSPVVVKFGLENMQVAKAGDRIENSGHHHILINVDELPDMKQPLPATEQIIHFGGAQTETSLDLPAGEHTLQLVLGNFAHIPHTPPVMSEKIRITVQ